MKNSADILASGCGFGGSWRVTDRQVVLVSTATSSLAPTGRCLLSYPALFRA